MLRVLHHQDQAQRVSSVQGRPGAVLASLAAHRLFLASASALRPPVAPPRASSSGPGTRMAAVVVAVEAATVPSSGACRSKSSSYLVRSLYWRLRAGLRRLQSSERAGRWRRGTAGGGRFSFHYDALSYALNFDDGGSASADFVR